MRVISFCNHPLFKSCEEFCERWDQSSFDPEYPFEELETFEPMLRKSLVEKRTTQILSKKVSYHL